MIYEYENIRPNLAEDVFIAPDATVIGRTKIAKGSSVWFGCLIRGDVDRIEIGEYTNIQDQSLIHVTGGKYPTIIGSHVTFGHRVTVHGATLKDHAFLGIGSTVLDNCKIGSFSILAAGSLLPPGKEIPDGMLAMGSPAKVVREISDNEREMILKTAEKYHKLGQQYAQSIGKGH